MYISDHDFQGFQIFLNLKYGSKNMAFLSQTQTCLQLEWVGPTMQDLETVAEAGSQSYIKDQAQNHLSWTKKDREEARQTWLTKKKTAVLDFAKNGQNAKFNAKEDTKLLQNWRELGLLKVEPALAKEALEIESSKHGVHISFLSLMHH